MKVRCIKNQLTEKECKAINTEMTTGPGRTDITLGKTYVVLSLSFYSSGSYFHGTIIDIIDDDDQYTRLPLCYFDVVDPRVSIFWRARAVEHGMRLWPAEFHREFFHDDLSDGVPEVVAMFNRAVERLTYEFDDPDLGDPNAWPFPNL